MSDDIPANYWRTVEKWDCLDFMRTSSPRQGSIKTIPVVVTTKCNLRGSVLLSLCGELLVSHAFTPFALALVFTFSQETFIPSATWWEDGVKQRVEGLPNTSLVCAGGVLFTVKSSQVWGTSRRSPYPPRSVVGASAELKRWSGRWLRRILPCMGN